MRPPSSFSSVEDQSLEILVSNISMQLRREGKTFFHKVISRSMVTEVIPGPFAYALEFPFPFVQENGELFKSANVTFERRNSDKRWPINITVRKFKHSRNRVFAFGEGGWKDFLMDNKLQVGDVVFFIWLGMSRYQVVVHAVSGRPLKNIDGASPAKRAEQSVLPSNRWSSNKCRTCWLEIAPPRPRFLVTVKPSHGPLHVEEEPEQESLNLEVPGSFWERHRCLLRGDELRLQGPNGKPAVMVKVMRTYHLEDEQEPKLSVRLERGWKAFLDANGLQLGDTLEFSLVEPMCFNVDLLDRGK